MIRRKPEWTEHRSTTGASYLLHRDGTLAIGRDAQGVIIKQLVDAKWTELLSLNGAQGYVGDGVAEDLFIGLIAAGVAAPNAPGNEILGLARSSVAKARQGAGDAGSRSDAIFQAAVILGRQWKDHLSPAYRQWCSDQALIETLLAASARLSARELGSGRGVAAAMKKVAPARGRGRVQL